MSQLEITPEFNDYGIGEPYTITLPVLVWAQIGDCLQYIDRNTGVHMPAGVGMLVQKINDMIFPRTYQLREQAKAEGQATARAESHPLTQIFRGIQGMGQIDLVGDPDDNIE